MNPTSFQPLYPSLMPTGYQQDYSVPAYHHQPSAPLLPPPPYNSLPHKQSGTSSTIQDETRYLQKRCKRCKQFYTDADESPVCHYHPGRYIQSAVSRGALVGWTCCRDLDKMDLVTDEHAKGCTTDVSHIEDTFYSETISRFPVSSSGMKEIRNSHDQPNTNVITPQETPQPQEDKDFIRHHVSVGDTLYGLSLRYNVSTHAIQRANRLMSHQIFHLKTINIPKTEYNKDVVPEPKVEDKRTLLLKKFKLEMNCGTEDAKYYLEAHDYEYEKAVEECRVDQRWETSQARNVGGPISVLHRDPNYTSKSKKSK